MGAALAVAVGLALGGCEGGDDGGDDGAPFVGGSDVLDGLYIGSLVLDVSSGLTMQVDQNAALVYGPITISDLSGNFNGSWAGTTIQFTATVSNGGRSGTFNFTGQITNAGRRFSGTFSGVLDGTPYSGNWTVDK